MTRHPPGTRTASADATPDAATAGRAAPGTHTSNRQLPAGPTAPASDSRRGDHDADSAVSRPGAARGNGRDSGPVNAAGRPSGAPSGQCSRFSPPAVTAPPSPRVCGSPHACRHTHHAPPARCASSAAAYRATSGPTDAGSPNHRHSPAHSAAP